MVVPFWVDVADALHLAPAARLVDQAEPAGHRLFAFAAKHHINIGVHAEVGLVVAQELGPAQGDEHVGQEGFDAGQDGKEVFVGEEPRRGEQERGAARCDFGHGVATGMPVVVRTSLHRHAARSRHWAWMAGRASEEWE